MLISKPPNAGVCDSCGEIEDETVKLLRCTVCSNAFYCVRPSPQLGVGLIATDKVPLLSCRLLDARRRLGSLTLPICLFAGSRSLTLGLMRPLSSTRKEHKFACSKLNIGEVPDFQLSSEAQQELDREKERVEAVLDAVVESWKIVRPVPS